MAAQQNKRQPAKKKTPARKRTKKKSTPSSRRKKTSSGKVGMAAFTGLLDHGILPTGLTSLKAAKLLIGILLLPVCWVALETFLALLRHETLAISFWKDPEVIAFLLGTVFWLVIFFGVRSKKLLLTYVFGHELTHVIFVLLFRGKVGGFHVSATGGHIMTNRNNFLISLSPYFFPFYSAVAVLVWAILRWVFPDLDPRFDLWFYGVIGLTWTFHLTFTLWMIRHEQPDVEQNGKIFSFAVIFLANLLILSAMIILASPTASFRGFGNAFVSNFETFPARLQESFQEVISILPL